MQEIPTYNATLHKAEAHKAMFCMLTS